MQPYSDDNMIYDSKTHRYILTPQAILEHYGEDMTTEVLGEPYQAIGVNAVLRTVSNHVYSFIHAHNLNNRFQDLLIDRTEGGRDKVYRAMLEQYANVRDNGDLSRVPDKNLREFWFDKVAAEILSEPLKEIGVPLTYRGRLDNFLYKICKE